jgi:phage tail protein X
MIIERRLPHIVLSLVTALVLTGCGSGGSSAPEPPPPPAADTTAPTVSAVQAPATVNRTVTLTSTASDNVSVTAVRFYVDGVLLGTDDTSPYSADWDTSGASEGDHTLTAEAEDAASNVATSAAVIVTVQNVLTFAVSPSGMEAVPVSGTQASAQASLTINIASGAVQGSMTTSGMTATAAHIHDAFAGTNGPVLIALDQDAGDPAIFNVPGGATLDAAGVERLLAGALYLNVHSAIAPGGEIRGQILPESFELRFTDLAGAATVPQVDSPARGRAAVTLDTSTGAVAIHAQVTGLDDATQAHLHQAYAGATGPALVALTQDATDPGHWLAEGETLNAAALDAFSNGELYINVHSPANPGGEIRGQVLPEGISVLFAELSGEQEVPRLDSSADGLASLTLDEAGAVLTIHVNTRGLDDASGTHLHNAFGGVNGPVEIGLNQDGGNPAHWFAEQQAVNAALLDALHSGGTYINVHSPTNPGGEIRGQVIPDDIVFAFGRLDGSQRVPAVATAASGTYAVTVDPETGTLVAHVNTSGVDDATAAHLHDGYAGNSGGVVIGLTQDPGDVAHWSAVGAPIDTAEIEALRSGRYYVNVHTPANPGGEIRGQVTTESIEVLFTDMSGIQEVPANASAASAVAASTVDLESGAVSLHLNATGADTATSSHIHLGFAGTNGGVLVALGPDAGNPGHWFVDGAQLDEAGLAAYSEGQLYVNLHTPTYPGGETRGQIAPPPIEVLFSTMTGDQEVPPVVTAASGIAASTVNRDTGALTLHVNASGADVATASHIHTASTGQNGPVLIGLQQDAGNSGHWSISGEVLDSDSLGDYKAGQLYVNLHTPANPGGEIRSQLMPPDAADFDNIDPIVDLASPGSPVSGIVTLTAEASDNQGVVEVRFLVDGSLIASDTTAPYSVDWSTAAVANGDVTLTAEAEDAAGNVGISAGVVVTVQNAAAVTLSMIQTEVFTPTCSGCHSGPTSNSLPSGMDLSSAASSFAALVNVPSLQVGALNRVTPGDTVNSYLIQKLEGTAAVGSRMPRGGPFLDQATMDMIEQWINDDAPNN